MPHQTGCVLVWTIGIGVYIIPLIIEHPVDVIFERKIENIKCQTPPGLSLKSGWYDHLIFILSKYKMEPMQEVVWTHVN